MKQLLLLSVVGFVVVSVSIFEKRSHSRAPAGLELDIGAQARPVISWVPEGCSTPFPAFAVSHT